MNAQTNPWSQRSTRSGQLTEMADTLSRAKGILGDVLHDYPEEAHGETWLEHAIALVGQCEDEIDAAAEGMQA